MLVFWAIIGTAIATIGAGVLGGISFLLTKRVVSGRWRVVLVCCVFPSLCLPWGGLGFQAIVNETVPHRDAGLGDTWRCPLPNGDALMMIDLMDKGWVYNPKDPIFRWGERARGCGFRSSGITARRTLDSR